MAYHARQVKGDDPDKKGYPGSPGWGVFGVRLTTPSNKNLFCEEASKTGSRKEKKRRRPRVNNDLRNWETPVVVTVKQRRAILEEAKIHQ